MNNKNNFYHVKSGNISIGCQKKQNKSMQIKVDDLIDGEVIALLEEHLADMYATSPPESVHALDTSALKDPAITFYSCWKNDTLLGCAALSI